MSSQLHLNAVFDQKKILTDNDNHSFGTTKGSVEVSADMGPTCVGDSAGYVKAGREYHMTERSLSADPGATVTIHDIQYTVRVKKRSCFGAAVDKDILKGIKLLDVLAGRKDSRGLSGDLLLDGCPPPHNFKCMVGYVVQDDVVMGTLTVRENFHFSAALRLPSSVSKEERKERVENVIQELGLAHCADTKVGTEFIRGVSGGERKRCNIGMELIISPPVLFLDEPTTGLDANTANTVMLLLKQMSMRGRTIVFSLHQPRYSIYRLFDRLMLLSLGECVYHGPAHESLDFFSSIGYPCQEHNNPPDFYLDVINAHPSIVTSDVNEIIASAANEEMHRNLVSSYKESPWCNSVTSELEPILVTHRDRVQTRSLHTLPPVNYATNFGTQFMHLSARNVKNLARNPAVSVMQVLVMLIYGLMVGAIFWKVDDSCKSGLQNRVGAFFFIIMNMIFGNLSAIQLFLQERPLFLHENVSGFYNVSAYFLSKVVCDILPMRLFPVAVFTATVYYMLGFRGEPEHFFIFMFSLFAVSLSASAVCFFFSACTSIFAVANLTVANTYVAMMVFSGLLVNLETVPDWLEWIKWVSLYRYSFEALAINELKDMTFGNGSCVTGNEYMDSQGISYRTAWDLWQNFVALGALIMIFLILTYLRLRFMNKLR